ncbi:MAG: DUF1593 domain-containing protein [Planctomycetota bacterium]
MKTLASRLREKWIDRGCHVLAVITFAIGLTLSAKGAEDGNDPTRLRLIVETDAGGDPDDEQSLIRFLLYANEWDIEGIIANRPRARDGENKNPQRTGLGIVQQLVDAYGACLPNLVQHDSRYPTIENLRERLVPGYDETSDAVELILRAVDSDDPRPVWYSDWGTDVGGATNNLRRALDRVLKERGPHGYAKFKQRLRLASANPFGDHTNKILPTFPLWIDTFRPEKDRLRWYHAFSGITAKAGGFDIERDLRTGHGPLGALYPLNTTHPQKEGDSMTFIYLIPTGMNEPEQPTWGSWAGRYGQNETFPDRPYYWANQADSWEGKTNRYQSIARWAVALQNDFAARADWCVARKYADANHPPRAFLNGDSSKRILTLHAKAGSTVKLSAAETLDPDGDAIKTRWFVYPEPGTYRGDVELKTPAGNECEFTAPIVQQRQTIHLILQVKDDGKPSLFAFRRAIITVEP